MQRIDVPRAQALVSRGAVLIDIREPGEFAREHIPGARPYPLSTFGAEPLPRDAPLIFHCRTDRRTADNAARLEAAASGDTYLLEGGLEAWKRAGLPVESAGSPPMPIPRQVQIVAGSVILLACILGFALDPRLHLLSGAVGVGLILSGLTGRCGTARLLAHAPWNRR